MSVRENDRLDAAIGLGRSVLVWLSLYLVGFWLFAYVTQGLVFPPPEPGGLVLLLVLFVVSRLYSRHRRYRE